MHGTMLKVKIEKKNPKGLLPVKPPEISQSSPHISFVKLRETNYSCFYGKKQEKGVSLQPTIWNYK